MKKNKIKDVCSEIEQKLISSWKADKSFNKETLKKINIDIEKAVKESKGYIITFDNPQPFFTFPVKTKKPNHLRIVKENEDLSPIGRVTDE